LCPGPHLKELLKSTKSAGHGDESVRQLGHHCLPLEGYACPYAFPRWREKAAGSVPTVKW
jgi:hypothetical protein